MAAIAIEIPHSPFTFAESGADERIALSEVISALSFALDLTEDAVPGHAVRSCLLGMRIGRELGLRSSQLTDLYYALLLKDIGCSSNAARMCQILGGDDRSAKRKVKTVDWTRISAAGLKLAWQNALPGGSPWQKFIRVAELGRNREQNNAEMIGLRCERGADIVRKIGLGESCADAIHSLDEHWNGSGYPDHLRGKATPLLARILGVAQHLDVFAMEQGRTHAIDTLVERSGAWFDPELVRVAVSLDRQSALWNGCGEPDERARVMDMEPGAARTIGPEQVDRVCEAFADVVDAKSPFTYRHSLGVTDAADALARYFGFGLERRQLIHRAALLHDLGKLAVSNTILDKPGKLEVAEWLAVREHPALSQKILERIPSFAGIATFAGRHHERLDGTGYPNHLLGRELSLDDRIVAMADVYGALSEDRPYRAALPPEKILAILREEVPGKLAPECFEAIQAFMEGKYDPEFAPQPGTCRSPKGKGKR
jgi:HD-GYP domain-containing protein (c-di-GMP phosphodiesterase class II)